MSPTRKQTLLVIGRGIIGLSIAYEMCRRGWHVTVVAPKERLGTASHAAIGVSSLKGHILPSQPLFYAKMKGHEQLPSWLAQIERDAGISIPKIREGVMEPFFDRAGFEYLSERVFHGRFRGCLRARLVGPRSADEGVLGLPFLATSILKEAPRGAFIYPGDIWFDPIQTLEALERAICRLGGEIRDDEVRRVIPRVDGDLHVECLQTSLFAQEVVLAAGAFSDQVLRESGLSAMALQNCPGETLYARTEDKTSFNLRLSKTNYVGHAGELRWGSTSRVGTSLDGELSRGVSAKGVDGLWEEALEMIKPQFLNRNASSVKWGIRTRVRDRAPVVGALFWPGQQNSKIWISLAFYKNGLQLAGLLADFLGERICGAPLHSFHALLENLVRPNRLP